MDGEKVNDHYLTSQQGVQDRANFSFYQVAVTKALLVPSSTHVLATRATTNRGGMAHLKVNKIRRGSQIRIPTFLATVLCDSQTTTMTRSGSGPWRMFFCEYHTYPLEMVLGESLLT